MSRIAIYRHPAYPQTVGDYEIREPTFLILTALAGGPQHGYAVIGDVEAISDGRVVLRAGTLYAALDRLLNDGLVADSGTEVVDGRLRRYYSLTDQGAAVLDTEVQRLRANASRAASRLRVRPSHT